MCVDIKEAQSMSIVGSFDLAQINRANCALGMFTNKPTNDSQFGDVSVPANQSLHVGI